VRVTWQGTAPVLALSAQNPPTLKHRQAWPKAEREHADALQKLPSMRSAAPGAAAPRTFPLRICFLLRACNSVKSHLLAIMSQELRNEINLKS